jgi:hypothetical protein
MILISSKTEERIEYVPGVLIPKRGPRYWSDLLFYRPMTAGWLCLALALTLAKGLEQPWPYVTRMSPQRLRLRLEDGGCLPL